MSQTQHPAAERGTDASASPKKLFIETHGCQMNEYDSAKMADVLAASDGLELTTQVEEADVILINTCSIRDKAQEKVFSQLGRWKHLKRRNPRVVIGVGGCVASQEGAAIIDHLVAKDVIDRLQHEVEPWLGRVAFGPSVSVGLRTRRVGGLGAFRPGRAARPEVHDLWLRGVQGGAESQEGHGREQMLPSKHAEAPQVFGALSPGRGGRTLVWCRPCRGLCDRLKTGPTADAVGNPLSPLPGLKRTGRRETLGTIRPMPEFV